VSRFAGLVIVVCALGCHRLGDAAGEDPGDATTGDSLTACDGAITRAPVVMAETIAYAPDVIVDGDTLVVVEPGQSGQLRRLDRCTAAELSSTPVPFLDRAIVHDGAVVFTGILEGPITYLERWDEAAEDLVFLSEAPFSRLFSHSTGLYLAAREQIHRYDPASASLELVHTIDTLDIPGLLVGHIGMNEAGIYYRRDYDCGCTPALSRWSVESGQTVGVPGTPGARRLATVGERIFLNVDQNPNGFGSGIDDIVELPIDGGEPQLLFSGILEDGPIQSIAANQQWVCWTNRVRPPRCMSRVDGELVEFDGQFDGEVVYRQIALAEDMIYWFVEQNGESTLMAAAL